MQTANIYSINPKNYSQTKFSESVTNFKQSIVKSVEKSEQENFSEFGNI